MAQKTQESAASGADSTPAKAEEFVEYVGAADVREITAAQWKEAGVEDQNKVVWERKNRKRVKLSEFNDDALEILRGDSGFKLPKQG